MQSLAMPQIQTQHRVVVVGAAGARAAEATCASRYRSSCASYIQATYESLFSGSIFGSFFSDGRIYARVFPTEKTR